MSKAYKKLNLIRELEKSKAFKRLKESHGVDTKVHVEEIHVNLDEIDVGSMIEKLKSECKNLQIELNEYEDDATVLKNQLKNVWTLALQLNAKLSSHEGTTDQQDQEGDSGDSG